MNISVQQSREKERHVLIGIVFALLAAVFFSIKAIFVKLAYRYGVDAVTLLTLRMSFALPFFLFIALLEGRKTGVVALNRKQIVSIIGLGLVGYYLASLFDFIGLQYISAGLERLILFLFPTFTVLLSRLFLSRKVSKIELQALLISYAGIVLAMQHELALAGENIFLGAVLIFGSTLAYAIYLIGSGELIPKVGARRFMAYAMVVSCCAVIIQYFVTGGADALHLPAEVYGYGLAIAVFSTVFPAFMLSFAIHRIGASHTSIFGGIGPVITIVMASFLLGETMGALQMAGTLLVISGVMLLAWSGRAGADKH